MLNFYLVLILSASVCSESVSPRTWFGPDSVLIRFWFNRSVPGDVEVWSRSNFEVSWFQLSQKSVQNRFDWFLNLWFRSRGCPPGRTGICCYCPVWGPMRGPLAARFSCPDGKVTGAELVKLANNSSALQNLPVDPGGSHPSPLTWRWSNTWGHVPSV